MVANGSIIMEHSFDTQTQELSSSCFCNKLQTISKGIEENDVFALWMRASKKKEAQTTSHAQQ